MRTQQLIAGIEKYATTIRIHLNNSGHTVRRIRERLPIFISQKIKETRPFWPVGRAALAAFFVALFFLPEARMPSAGGTKVGKAGVFFETVAKDYSTARAPNHESLAREALLWLSVLKSYNDFELTNRQLMLKFKNMGIACTILSCTADGPLRRKFWSQRAVKYSRLSLGVIEGLMPPDSCGELEEVNTRLLIAMALSYYEDGPVERGDIQRQFEAISKPFLIRTGFCNNKILKTLHDDGIIVLPIETEHS